MKLRLQKSITLHNKIWYLNPLGKWNAKARTIERLWNECMPAILFGFLISSSISEKNHLTQFHTSTSRTVTMPACVRTYPIYIESTAITSFQRRFNEKLSIGCCRRCFLVLYPLSVLLHLIIQSLYSFSTSPKAKDAYKVHTHIRTLSVWLLWPLKSYQPPHTQKWKYRFH